MELLFTEQDLIDSICVYTAAKEYTTPESIDADLAYSGPFGFSATVNTRRQSINLNEQDLIDAVVFYLHEYHNFNPDYLFVDLRFTENEGISASIQVKSFG